MIHSVSPGLACPGLRLSLCSLLLMLPGSLHWSKVTEFALLLFLLLFLFDCSCFRDIFRQG